MSSLLFRCKRNQGYSLIEVLLVLAIIGILSGIAIPRFLGQRRRARVIGDAISNAKVIAMMMETRRADAGVYGPDGNTYQWTSGVPVGSAATFLPGFQPSGNSKMDYSITIAAGGLAFTTTVLDPSLGGVQAYQTDQNGAELYRLH
jgi:prepilin-type N-terminal cleavage/methylation domain-containing protein